MVAFRYSDWDGRQEIPALDADEVLEALTDDLMNFGDLQHAMRNLLQRGMRNSQGNRLQGLRDLLQQLRQQRRSTLDRYNLSSVIDDIKNKLDEIVGMERATIDRRLDEATGGHPDAPPADEQPPSSIEPSPSGAQTPPAPPQGQQSHGQAGEPGEGGQPSSGAQQPS